MTINYNALEEQLSYHFSNQTLLEEALRHSSFVNEQPDSTLTDNERLEFLGDAVLSLIVSDLLMQTFPDEKEGQLSRLRADLVNESRLAAIARSIGLGDFLSLGNGEIQSNGREKNSILADAMEAVIAAAYLDKGYKAAYGIIERHFRDLIEGALERPHILDFKSRLQEIVQIKFKAVPTYEIVGDSGPDHDKTFYVEMTVGPIQAKGSGKSKKAAEQDAARQGLMVIEQDDPSPDSTSAAE